MESSIKEDLTQLIVAYLQFQLTIDRNNMPKELENFEDILAKIERKYVKWGE